MRKFFYSFVVTLVIIITSIAYLGNVNYTQLSSSVSRIDNNNNNEFVNKDETKKCDETSSHLNETKFNFLSRKPDLIKCNLNYSNDYSIKTDRSSFYDYSRPALNQTHNLRIIRAILIYFPIEKYDEFELEFKWLYRSWIEMQKHEPAKWRTDLIVFIDHENEIIADKNDFFLNELNCSILHKRTSPTDEPMCSLIHYKPLKNRDITKLNVDFKDLKEYYNYILNNINIFDDNDPNLSVFYESLKKISNYGYLDSILMAFDGYSYFKSAGYNFLIRSDMDVFLTPLFGKWLPRFCNDFYVGRGGYSATFNLNRLKRIANDLEFKYAAETNLGSTWYSTPDQFRLVSYMTLFGMVYLSEEEFTLPEREGKLGVMLWPYWHYGVLLLYGQNLALNHLIATKQLNIVKLEQHLDYPSYFNEDVNKMLHIHVFHGDMMFSKFQFKAGKYNDLNADAENTNIAKFYSLKMALEAKRTSNENLVKLFSNELNKKL